ncbi:MAG: DUF58 domain-containing protein [Verrucomicrobiales bacterium]
MESIREIIKKIRRLEIRTRRMVDESVAGQYHSVFRGRGMNFEDVRPYQVGDDTRSIDWNVTARSGEPHIKIYTEERELTILLALDLSGSGIYGSVERSKKEIAAELASVLAFSAVRNNDQVGLLLFTSQKELFLRPAKGRSHALRIIREALFYEPQQQGTDVGAALEFLGRLPLRRAVLFVLSDFICPDFERALMVAARKHDVVAARLEDPAEHQLPKVGWVSLQDPESGELIEVNTSDPIARAEWERARLAQRERVEATLQRQNVDLIDIRVDQDYLPKLRGFFRRRERRMLLHM